MILHEAYKKQCSESFNKLKDHYSRDARKFGKKETKENALNALPLMISLMKKERDGYKDEAGKTIINDIKLGDVTQKHFGVDWKEFLHDIGLRTNFNSIADIGTLAAGGNADMKFLKDSMAFAGSVYSTNNVNDNYRFLIPEIILQVVATYYQQRADWQNWTAGSYSVSTRSGIKVPRIERGDTFPRELQEGQKIPYGTVQFGQKSVEVKKYGIGIPFTKEVMMEMSIDLLAGVFLPGVTSDMNIGENSKARAVLLNGEQADLSESAAIVGVNATADGFTEYDIDIVKSQLAKLGMNGNTLMGSTSNLLLDLNSTKPERERRTIQAYHGGASYQYNLPDADTVLFFDRSRAMSRLQYGAMTIENDYDPATQVESAYVSFYSGFFISKRDARVLLDKSVTFASTPWPAFMDVDALRLEEFPSF